MVGCCARPVRELSRREGSIGVRAMVMQVYEGGRGAESSMQRAMCGSRTMRTQEEKEGLGLVCWADQQPVCAGMLGPRFGLQFG